MSTCQGCGTALQQARRGRPRKWCSERCRKLQYASACIDCGGVCNTDGSVTGASRRCIDCERASLRTLESRHAHGGQQTGNVVHTNEAILAALRAASTNGVITKPMYEASGHSPSVPTIVKRFGRFNAAAAAAGLRTSCRDQAKPRIDRIDDEALLDAVRDCAAAVDDAFPVHATYEEWAQRTGAPSASAVRNRFGTWLNVMDLLATKVAA